MPGKMHELLAAEVNVVTIYNNLLEESLKVLRAPANFIRENETLTFLDAADAQLNTSRAKEMVTTVSDRLAYFFGRPFVNRVDLMLQKDTTNQLSKADVVVNGQTILKEVPAVTLLSWEGQLDSLRELLLSIPTLDASKVWVEDPAVNLWRVKDTEVTFHTKKVFAPVVMVQPTKEHPAQVKELYEDRPVARKEKLTYSGMWTSKQKADILSRLDALHQAVKKARQRANRATVVQVKAGQVLADFILNGPEADQLTGTDTQD